MDYKKKYENALEWARQVINGECGFIRNEVEEVFPELKESEDEIIRKEIIAEVKEQIDSIPAPDCRDKEDEKVLKQLNKWLTWLEKQGGHKPFDYENINIQQKDFAPKSAMEAIKGEKVDNANKVEPKFKGEDWITNGQLTCKVLSVTSKSYELHLYNDDYFLFETDVQSVDNDYHLWTIKDAKNGDVLTSIGFHSNCTFIFNGLDNWKFDEPNGDRVVATGYCCLFVSADKMELGMQGPDCIEVDTVKPATKIQRNLLFQKMKEAGWSWNPETKELSQTKETEKSDAWSDEDERLCQCLIRD